jgi:nitronate monooxygenase
MMVGGERVFLPKGHGLPPGTAATGHIEAMPMYAGESAAAVSAVEPTASVIESWAAAAGTPG